MQLLLVIVILIITNALILVTLNIKCCMGTLQEFVIISLCYIITSELSSSFIVTDTELLTKHQNLEIKSVNRLA